MTQSYNQFLIESGLTESIIQVAMNDRLIIDTINNRGGLFLHMSELHGVGVFAEDDIRAGKIYLARAGKIKFLCGRFMNHSGEPNCIFTFDKEHTQCMVLRDIKPFEELTVDYLDNWRKLSKQA